MSLNLKKKDKYKSYVEDYGSNKSSMKMVYILIGLTVLTVALVVLLVMFLNGTFGGEENTVPTPTPGQTDTTVPEDSDPPIESENPGTPDGEKTVSVSISKEVPQIPEGTAPEYIMGTGDKLGYVVIDNSLKNKGDLILSTMAQPLDGTYSLFREVNVYNESINVMKEAVNVSNTNITFERRALSALVEMLKGAKDEGHTKYFVDKAYVKADEKDMDYRTGLAFDIGFIRLEEQGGGKFAELPQGKYIIENSYLYGFVQRYTIDKKAITGMDSDVTHYRYVGFPHSYVMKAKGMCLEEYVEYIRRSGSIEVKKNDKLAYEVSYCYLDPQSTDGKTAYKLSDAAFKAYSEGKAKLTVSGDNFAGFIVTVIYN